MNVRISIGSIAKAGMVLSLTIGVLAILLSRFNPLIHSMLASLAISLSFPLTVIIYVSQLRVGEANYYH